MSLSPEPTPVNAQELSRRELQYLARELKLCRGNAKSDVIVEHVVALMATNDGAARVQKAMDGMPDDIKTRTPAAMPLKSVREPQREDLTQRAVKVTEEDTPRRSSRKSADSTTSEPEVEPAQTVTNTTKTYGKEKSRATGGDSPSTITKIPPEKSRATGGDSPSTTTKISAQEAVVTLAVESPAVKAANAPVKKRSVISLAAKPASMPEPVLATNASTTPTRRTGTTPVETTRRSPLANVSNLSAPVKALNVEDLVNSASDLMFVGSERVKCTTTGHEMKADYDVITAYMAGKRYQRARTQKRSFTEFAPMFVDHPDEEKPHMVWCSVTQTAIVRDVERIQAHIQGSRYQKELPQWQADQEAAAAAAALEAEEQAARAKAIAANATANKFATDAKPSGGNKKSKKRNVEAIRGEELKRSRVKVVADNV